MAEVRFYRGMAVCATALLLQACSAPDSGERVGSTRAAISSEERTLSQEIPIKNPMLQRHGTYVVSTVAAGPADYFVPWTRSVRYQATAGLHVAVTEELFVSRVKPGGSVFGNTWTPALHSGQNQYDSDLVVYGRKVNGVAAAWVNDSCLVAWGIGDSRGTSPGSGGVYATTISAQGAVGPIVTVATGSAKVQALASDGNSAQLVWESGTLKGSVGPFNTITYGWAPAAQHTTHLSSQGAVLAQSTNTAGTNAKIAWGGSAYLQVWADGPSVLARRSSSDGSVLDQTPIVVASTAGASGALVTAHDSVFLVAWTQTASANNTDVYASRVGADGSLLDPAPIPLRTTPSAESALSVTAGDEVFVVMHTGASAYSGVSFDGEFLGNSGPMTATPHLTHAAGEYFAVSGSQKLSLYEGDASFLVTLIDDMWSPNVTGGADNFLLNWSQSSGYPHPTPSVLFPALSLDETIDARAARLTASGQVVDAPAITIPARGHAHWNGASHVVVVNGAAGDRAYRMAPDGTVLDATMIAVPGPLAASDGTRSLFVTLSGQRQFFDSNLQPMGALSEPLSPGCGASAVIWNGAHYVVKCAGFAHVLSQTGEIVASAEVMGSVAGGEGRTLFFWKSAAGDIRAEVRDETLAIIAPETVVSPPQQVLGSSDAPVEATWDSDAFVILWKYSSSLYAARLNANGTVLSPLFSVASNVTSASVAAAPDGTSAVFYTARDAAGGAYAPLLANVRLLARPTEPSGCALRGHGRPGSAGLLTLVALLALARRRQNLTPRAVRTAVTFTAPRMIALRREIRHQV